MRLLVCGGRAFADWAWLSAVLDKGHAKRPVTLVLHGGAHGADNLAGQWAKLREIPCLTFPANWAKHGPAAGPIRNQQMLVDGSPDYVVAFPGGAGTADMCRRARAAGLPVFEVKTR